VRDIFVEDSDEGVSNSVAFKASGIEFFLSISGRVINILAKDRKYTEEAFKRCILSAQDHLDEAEILSPDFWKSGSIASKMNKGGITKKAAEFSAALSKADNEDIEI